MLSGLILGDNIKGKDNRYDLITDREESELYAIINERGLNNSYLVAAVLVILLFGLFIFLVSRRVKDKRIINICKSWDIRVPAFFNVRGSRGCVFVPIK